MTRRPLLVLVADACPDVTETLALLLQAWGHEPLTANDGPAALELALSPARRGDPRAGAAASAGWTWPAA